jgi:hypothetical protein
MRRLVNVMFFVGFGLASCGGGSGDDTSFAGMCSNVMKTVCNRCWQYYQFSSSSQCYQSLSPDYCAGGQEKYCEGTGKSYDPSSAPACLSEAKSVACSEMFGSPPPACEPSVVCK